MNKVEEIFMKTYERGLNKGKIMLADVLLNFILENREKITVDFIIDALREIKESNNG